MLGLGVRGVCLLRWFLFMGRRGKGFPILFQRGGFTMPILPTRRRGPRGFPRLLRGSFGPRRRLVLKDLDTVRVIRLGVQDVTLPRLSVLGSRQAVPEGGEDLPKLPLLSGAQARLLSARNRVQRRPQSLLTRLRGSNPSRSLGLGSPTTRIPIPNKTALEFLGSSVQVPQVCHNVLQGRFSRQPQFPMQ